MVKKPQKLRKAKAAQEQAPRIYVGRGQLPAYGFAGNQPRRQPERTMKW
jgi:hypothetical protein